MEYREATDEVYIEIERDNYDVFASPDASANVFRDGEVVRELQWRQYDSPFPFNVRLKGEISGDEEEFYQRVSEEIREEINERSRRVMEETKGMSEDEAVDHILSLEPEDFFER